MNWTEEQKQIYEAIASQVYGRNVVFQPINKIIQLDFAPDATIDVQTGLILFGTLSVGLPTRSTIIQGAQLVQNAPSINRGLTFTLANSATCSVPVEFTDVLFDEIYIDLVTGDTTTGYWNFTGYACKLT